MQREIEEWSPQILGHDKEIWRQFIKRDAPGCEAKYLSPSDNSLWYETYQEAVAQSKKEVAEDERILKAKMDEIKMHRSEHTSKQVAATTVPKLPAMGGMKVVKYLKDFYGEDYQPRKHRHVGLVKPPTKLTFGAGSRIKAKTGPEMLNKARKEAREQKSLRGHLGIPTHKLQKQASQIRQVPYSMAADYIKPTVPQPIDPTIKPTEVFVPKRKRVITEAEPARSKPSSVNDEALPNKRLRIATASSKPSNVNDEASSNKKLKIATASSKPSSVNDEAPLNKNPKIATASSASSEEAEIHPTRLRAQVSKAPQPQPLNQSGKPVRPPMKAKRPVNIFLPTKKR